MTARGMLYQALLGVAAGAALTGLVLPAVVERDAPTAVEASAGPVTDTGAPADTPTSSDEPGDTNDPVAPGAQGGTDDGAPEQVAGDSPAAPTGGGRTLRAGFLLADVAAAGRMGIDAGVDPAQQRAAWQVLVDDLRTRGVELEPFYEIYDLTSQDDMRRACLALTEDHEVAVAFDAVSFQGPSVLCITDEHATPLLMGGSLTPVGYHDRSGGRLVTQYQAGARILANLAGVLDEEGVLRDRTIGILDDARPGSADTVTAGLVSTLEGRGHEVAYRATLSAQLPEGSSQIPVAVQEMRRHGVDLVMLAANTLYGQQFAQQADAQGYRPLYVTSDWSAGATDVYGQNMPASFDGSIAVTVTRIGEAAAGLAEPDLDRRCRERYERGSGRSLSRGSSAYGITMMTCNAMATFEAALQSGGDVTAGVPRIGPIGMANFGGGSYRPGKTDAADLVRILRFASGCRCWRATGSFRPAPY